MFEPLPPSPDHLCIERVETLSDDWGVLRKITFGLRRRDGTWQTQSRESYDRVDGATILQAERQLMRPEDTANGTGVTRNRRSLEHRA